MLVNDIDNAVRRLHQAESEGVGRGGAHAARDHGGSSIDSRVVAGFATVVSARSDSRGVFYRKVPSLRVFDIGSPLGDFAEGIDPRAGELVIIKQYASAFFGTSLAALGADTSIITGVTTSGCVRATTLDAMQHGFIPYVVRDAVGDRDQRPHDANLFDLAAKYAEVVSVSEIAALIENRAGWIQR
jgi:nicotinamidase-related amidase